MVMRGSPWADWQTAGGLLYHRRLHWLRKLCVRLPAELYSHGQCAACDRAGALPALRKLPGGLSGGSCGKKVNAMKEMTQKECLSYLVEEFKDEDNADDETELQ